MFPHRVTAFLAGAAALAVACHKIEYTGRLQYNLIPDSIMRGIGKSSYQAQLSESKVLKEGSDKEKLLQVGKRVSRAADEPKYDWRFNLVNDDDTVNAWCLPGGYIAFYTGILPVLRNEAGMAFVMGHEIAHATAHHGAERMSQQLTLIGGLIGLEVYMANGTDLEPQKRALILGALGIGTELAVILPFSRTHESEADVIGMMYAAEAGYPPEESIAMWDRMDKISPDGVPSFLSTHPSNEARQANLREWMPRAKKKYMRHKLQYETQKVLWEGIPGRKKKNL
jgi:predicted Zn-dependent protease